MRRDIRKIVRKLVTKATRRPRRGPWPPDPARVRSIVEGLEELYPDVDCELDRETPFQLVCATILSAQCTDERVNMVTPDAVPALSRRRRRWRRRRCPRSRRSSAAPASSARRRRASRARRPALLARFGGEVPQTIAELTTLPGVARKTANVVLGTAYGIAEGVVVDTHVQRLSMRLGLTRKTDPKDIEQDLMQVIPQENWIRFWPPADLARPARLLRAQAELRPAARWRPFCPSAGLES